MRIRSLIACGLLSLAACGDDGPAETGGGGEGGAPGGGGGGAEAGGSDGVGGSGGEAAAVEWGSCEQLGYLDECATLQVPLDHSGADPRTIDLHITRSVGAASGPKKTLWFLNGGPGGSGAGFASFVDIFRERLGDGWDFYTVDHRGTGLSTLLCPDQEGDGQIANNEWDPCLGVLLDDPVFARSFSTTQASHDVLYAISLVRQPGDEAHLYGYSYGAYWGIRTSQIGGSDIHGAILGGIPAPGRLWFAEWDPNADEVGQRLVEHCLAEEQCNTEMGGDPWARIGEAFTLLGQGHCSEADLDPAVLRILLNYALDRPELRSLVFPTIQRFTRCNAEDVAALGVLKEAVSDALGYPLGGSPFTTYSQILHYNVTFSELLMDPENPYTTSEAAALFDESYFGAGFASFYIDLSGIWPTYERDPAIELGIDPSTPLLMVNGELDARTVERYARLFGEEQAGPAQTYFEIPFGGHGVRSDCELDMYAAFLSDPSAAVDGGCLSGLDGFTTAVSAKFADAWMGTTDLWGGDPTLTSSAERRGLRAELEVPELLPLPRRME